MKKTLTLLVAVMVTLCVTSCCKSYPTLPASKAKTLAQKEMARTHANKGYVSMSIGYYECNNADTRYALRQLAACEMITYSCQRVPKYIRRYWGTDTVTTYFVTTALTEKGEKLLADTLHKSLVNKLLKRSEFEPWPTADEKDLKRDKEIDMSKFPESSVEYAEFPEDKVAAATEEISFDDNYGIDEGFYAPDVSNDRSPYDIAKQKEKYDEVLVKAFMAKVVKARNIEVSVSPTFTAEAELVLEFINVTPFGRIFHHVYNGQRAVKEDVDYVYYQDKKWTVKN